MIKKSFYQKFKVITSIFLVGIIFFSNIGSVSAEALTIEKIDEEFKKVFVEEFNKLGGNFSTTVNEEGKKYEISEDGEKIASFNLGDNYIEYDNRNNTATQENIDENFAAMLCISGIIRSILNLSNYTNKELNDESLKNLSDFETYGLQVETDEYEFSGSSDDGSSWMRGGDYTKYFKMSFESEKIKALVEKYGTDSTEDSGNEMVKNLVPTLKASNITENSVTLIPKVSYANSTVLCLIYRSDSANGNYEKISEAAVNCVDSVGLVDDNLKSSSTYYYKAIVLDGTKFGDVIKVTTKSSNYSNSNEIPETGAFFNVIMALIIMLGSICTIIYARKKSVFKKI